MLRISPTAHDGHGCLATDHLQSKAGKFRLRSKEIRFTVLSSNYRSYLKSPDAKRNLYVGSHRLP